MSLHLYLRHLSVSSSSQTPKITPRKEFNTNLESTKPTRTVSPDGGDNQTSLGLVEEALERLLMKSPSRRDSYSDSTDDEEVEEAFSPSMELSSQSWDRSVYQTPANMPSMGRHVQYETACELDDTFRSAYYSPNQSICKR